MSYQGSARSELLHRHRSSGARIQHDDYDEDEESPFSNVNRDIAMSRFTADSRFTDEIDPLQPLPASPEQNDQDYYYQTQSGLDEEYGPDEEIPWAHAEDPMTEEEWRQYQHQYGDQDEQQRYLPEEQFEQQLYNKEEPERFAREIPPLMAQQQDPIKGKEAMTSAAARPYSSTTASAYEVFDVRGYRVLQGKHRWGITPEPFTQTDAFNEGRLRSQRLPHFEGLRGILAFQTLLWIFFRLFAPAIVTDTAFDGTQPAAFAVNAPGWMEVIRKLFSPLFFSGTLQMTMYIMLVGRVSMQTFVERREAICLAGPCFRRPIRILVPIAVCLAIVSIMAATNGFKYAQAMADNLQNDAAVPPKEWRSILQYLNSLFAFLFQPFAYTNSAAVEYIPGGRITWFIDVVYQQTYVLAIFCFTLPFTIFKYKCIGIISFIILSAWVDRWSWYTLTGLALSEFSVIYQQLLPGHGRLGKSTDPLDLQRRESALRRPSLSRPHIGQKWLAMLWSLPPVFIVVGIVFKYLWIAALPQYFTKELYAHGDPHTGLLTTAVTPSTQAYPRYDDWFLCTGVLIAIELSTHLQRFFSWAPFVYLGRLGFSIALIAGTVMLSLGSLLHTHLVDTLAWDSPAKVLAVEFFAMVPFALACADIYSRIIDDFSLSLSHELFKFARN